MKAYKLEVFIIDMDKIGQGSIVSEIENTHYSNRCISPRVKNVQEVDIGEWHDDHPLNKHSTQDAEYKRLFDSISYAKSVVEESRKRMDEMTPDQRAELEKSAREKINHSRPFDGFGHAFGNMH